VPYPQWNKCTFNRCLKHTYTRVYGNLSRPRATHIQWDNSVAECHPEPTWPRATYIQWDYSVAECHPKPTWPRVTYIQWDNSVAECHPKPTWSRATYIQWDNSVAECHPKPTWPRATYIQWDYSVAEYQSAQCVAECGLCWHTLTEPTYRSSARDPRHIRLYQHLVTAPMTHYYHTSITTQCYEPQNTCLLLNFVNFRRCRHFYHATLMTA